MPPTTLAHVRTVLTAARDAQSGQLIVRHLHEVRRHISDTSHAALGTPSTEVPHLYRQLAHLVWLLDNITHPRAQPYLVFIREEVERARAICRARIPGLVSHTDR